MAKNIFLPPLLPFLLFLHGTKQKIFTAKKYIYKWRVFIIAFDDQDVFHVSDLFSLHFCIFVGCLNFKKKSFAEGA